MITPILEKLLLRGDANYVPVTHALGMFGRIPTTQGKIAIIESILWHQFLNPIKTIAQGITWNEFFKYNEYQLKIDGEKTVSYYHFRNRLKWTTTDYNHTIIMTDVINPNLLATLDFQPEAPVKLDTFLVCGRHAKITISRNCMINTLVPNMGQLNQRATEQKPPNGVDTVTVLRQLAMSSPGGNTQYYNPPTNDYSGVIESTVRNIYPYTQDIIPKTLTSFESELTPVTTDSTTSLFPLLPYLTHPLVTFGVVYINESIAHELQSTT